MRKRPDAYKNNKPNEEANEIKSERISSHSCYLEAMD